MASTIKLKTYPLPKLYKTLSWLNSSRRRVLKNWKILCMKEVMKRFKPLRRAIILETSGFSYFFNAHFDKLCKNRWEEALFAAFVPTVIRSERCAIQKDAVSFSAHARKSRTTTKHESILITIHFWQETLFNQTNCSVLNQATRTECKSESSSFLYQSWLSPVWAVYHTSFTDTLFFYI